MSDQPTRITLVEAQRRTGVPGPDLIEAVSHGEIPALVGDDSEPSYFMVYLHDVEAWAARRAS